ncbi:MAG: CcmD family protein [Ignavibacteriaceae bacterium]|nr:CcmD family protein [Ignavibacteriaceae bacterium]
MDFLSQNAIYIVLIIALIVWGGVFGYLYVLDKRLQSIEKEMKK